MRARLLLATLAIVLASACSDNDDDQPRYNTLYGQYPVVIGHRGASGERPEHTLESYTLAIEQGADLIEPDLVLTSDGVMIARHEPMLDATTDVADKFPASRMSTKLVDGVSTTAYFAGDFTLAEIKTMRAKQSRAGRSTQYDGQFEIPTLADVILLAKEQSRVRGYTVGINDRRVNGTTGVVEAAHARGLFVHTWTFRNDASGYGFADPQAEMAYYMKLGVDGVFTDFPATGVAARRSLN